jgi:hypothetical protein
MEMNNIQSHHTCSIVVHPLLGYFHKIFAPQYILLCLSDISFRMHLQSWMLQSQ